MVVRRSCFALNFAEAQDTDGNQETDGEEGITVPRGGGRAMDRL